MRFTNEIEMNDSISFIGIKVMHTIFNNLHGFTTSVFRKPTSTALFMNYNSFTPLAYRLSVFKCLVHRALHLCSNWSLFHFEIGLIRTMLLRNAYPGRILDKIIKSSLHKFVNPLPVFFGPKKERLYIGLPFLGKCTDNLRRTIRQLSKKFLPHKDVIVYFKSGRTISSFFRKKDTTPFEMRSHIVYKYSCAVCNNSYIGQTTRHLRHRISEHRGVSHLTGKVMKCLTHSSVRDHLSCCPGSTCLPEHFTVLSTGSTDLELLIKERLLINQYSPNLNANVGSFELLLS